MRETLIGDVFIYKSSWKTKYNNNEEDPDENGYYINKIYIDRNYSTSVNDTHMTLVANIIINPDMKIFKKPNKKKGILINDLILINESISQNSKIPFREFNGKDLVDRLFKCPNDRDTIRFSVLFHGD